MYNVSVTMWWCAVRREVRGFSAEEVAHHPVFNLELVACCPTEINGIRVWREPHATVH
jgi:hypothetical protein